MSVNLQALLQQGINSHNAGHLEDAENCYREILRHKPSHADANNLLGMIAFQVGAPEQAIPLIAKAIKKKPKIADFHRNMGAVLGVLGRYDEALLSFRKVLSIDPKSANAHFNIGNVNREKGALDEAVSSYQKALKIKPDYVEALENLAGVFLALGRFEESIDFYRKVLEISPDSERANLNLGTALSRQGNLEEALKFLRKSLRINPNNQITHNSLGNTLKQMGQMDEAISSYQKALNIQPDYGEAIGNLGAALGDMGKLDEAEKYSRRAVENDPENPEAHFNLANILAEQGQLKEAVVSYRRTLNLNPDFAEAYHQLMQTQKQTSLNDDIRAMDAGFQSNETPDGQRMYLAFGLGKAFEDLKEFDKAFEYMAEANRLKRQSFSFSIDQENEKFDQITRTFDAEFFNTHENSGNPDPTPIFILGMPRSGTSLVEQILASHPSVTGAGELTVLATAMIKLIGEEKEYPEGISSWRPGEFSKLGSLYLEGLRKHSSDSRFITDKLPHNFLYIGLIKAALPNAKIIHCRRDPIDTCLSIFKNHFVDSHPYAYDLKELGTYHNQYVALMEHWHRVIPGYIYDIQYEELVADSESQIRLLLEACGLSFDKACLSFHETKRDVRTVSASQVRRPIYRDSLQLWKRYENQLSPLIEELYPGSSSREQ